MAKHHITSAFWTMHSETMRPTLPRDVVARRLEALPLPAIPKAAPIVEARDAIVAALDGPDGVHVPDGTLEAFALMLFYMPGGYHPDRHGIVNQAMAHVAWDFIPMTRGERREWDDIVRTMFKGDAEEAAMRMGHRHVLPRFDLMRGSAFSRENDATPGRQETMRRAFAALY